MTTTTLTVLMHRKLIDRLDNCLSLLDGIFAIDDIFLELPKLHPQQAITGRRHKPRKSVRVFRGRFGWFALGFNYVHILNELHVIELWKDDDWGKPDRKEVEVVLGKQSN